MRPPLQRCSSVIQNSLSAVILMTGSHIALGSNWEKYAGHEADGLRVSFDIGSQPLGAALRQFALQGDVQIIFSEDDVKDAMAGDVRGNFFPHEAISKLISGGALVYEVRDKRVVIVRVHPIHQP
jgi:hypothetical protein